MSLYLDTSVLLKLIFLEPETQTVLNRIEHESELTISSLARLEAITAIRARQKSGILRHGSAKKRVDMLDALINTAPFKFQQCPADIFAVAERQLTMVYCPTLDGLHLATMQSLRIQRLLTHDSLQAKAARRLGFSVNSL